MLCRLDQTLHQSEGSFGGQVNQNADNPEPSLATSKQSGLTSNEEPEPQIIKPAPCSKSFDDAHGSGECGRALSDRT